MNKLVSAAAGLLLCLACTTPLMAEDAPAPAPAPAAPFSDADVASFAKAAVKVQVITQQARMQMMQAIESTDGMNVDTYNSIVAAAQKDPTLAEKISGLMRDYAKDAGIDTGDGKTE